MNIALPFVGRAKEIALLQRLHAQRKHVLILGAKGVGKSALVAHLRQSLRLHVCPASERLSEICEALEREFRLDAGDFHLIQRKNRLLRLLKESQRAVVFDGASWTTPKLASFIESVSERRCGCASALNIPGTLAASGRCWCDSRRSRSNPFTRRRHAGWSRRPSGLELRRPARRMQLSGCIIFAPAIQKFFAN